MYLGLYKLKGGGRLFFAFAMLESLLPPFLLFDMKKNEKNKRFPSEMDIAEISEESDLF